MTLVKGMSYSKGILLIKFFCKKETHTDCQSNSNTMQLKSLGSSNKGLNRPSTKLGTQIILSSINLSRPMIHSIIVLIRVRSSNICLHWGLKIQNILILDLGL